MEFTLERLSSDYSRNRIGRSLYENGKSCMNIFQTFLRATKQGTYRPDSIFVGDMTPELLDSYINTIFSDIYVRFYDWLSSWRL